MSAKLQQTEIGRFPSAWEVRRVDSVFDIQQGKQVSKKNRSGENQRPFLRTKNVFWNRLELTELDQMNFTESEQERLELRANDLLVCEGGSIGRTALWNNEVDGCLHQNHLHRLRARDDKADPQFGVYWLWYAFDVAKIYFGRGNVTTIPNLSQSKLAELPMALPPFPEQKKIAHILSTVQRAIEAQERIIQTTTELKNALMHKLFTEGLRNEPQKQTEIGPIPESWEICTVPDSLQKTRVGRRQQIPAKEIAETGVHPVVDQGQTFVSGFTDDSERLIDFDLPLIIFGDHTRHFKFVDFPFVLGADGTKVLKPKPGLFDPKFFFYALVVLKLPSRGYNRHFKILKEKIIPRPSIEEQREIANAIDAIENKAKLAESKRSTLNDLFRTLLHELMTAKIRVHNLIA